MWQKILDLLKTPSFPDDEEKNHCAPALNALHLNMGGAMLGLGILGVLFFFPEKKFILHYFSFGHPDSVDWYGLESGEGSIFYFTLPSADSQGIL